MRAIGQRVTESGIVEDRQSLNVASAASYESRVASKQVLEVSRLVAQDSKLELKFEKVRT